MPNHTLIKSLLLIGSLLAALITSIGATATELEEGKKLAFNRSKGNCLACHYINDPEAELPGTIGPALIGMRARYPNFDDLYDKLYTGVEGTMMPPFGSHQILSSKEIELIAKYVHSL